MDRWMDKEDMVCIYVYTHTLIHTYIHNGTLFSHEKQGNSAICNNMDGWWGYYAKWNTSEKGKYSKISLTHEI